MSPTARLSPLLRVSAALAVLPPQSAPIARTAESAAMALERVVTMGDLRDLTPVERVNYYLDLCQSLALHPRVDPSPVLVRGLATRHDQRTATPAALMAELTGTVAVSKRKYGEDEVREIVDGTLVRMREIGK